MSLALAICDIDQRVESPVRRVEIATRILELTHCKIAAVLITGTHLLHAILRASQSSSGGPLNRCIDIRMAAIKHIYNCFTELSTRNHIPDPPASHRVGL